MTCLYLDFLEGYILESMIANWLFISSLCCFRGSEALGVLRCLCQSAVWGTRGGTEQDRSRLYSSRRYVVYRKLFLSHSKLDKSIQTRTAPFPLKVKVPRNWVWLSWYKSDVTGLLCYFFTITSESEILYWSHSRDIYSVIAKVELQVKKKRDMK